MTNTRMKWSLAIGVLILLANGAMTTVLSDNVAGEDLSPGQIFQKLHEQYAALTSYSDQGTVVATMNDTTTTTTFTTQLARTNFYMIEWRQTIESPYATNNADVQAVWSSGAGNFLEMGLGPQNEESREIALAKATEISGGAAGTVPQTFFDVQWGSPLNDSGLDENRLADGKVSDMDCYVLARELQGRTRTLWIGKQDFLIHQVRTVTSAEAMRTMLAATYIQSPALTTLLRSSNPNFFIRTETHTGIVVNKQFLRSDFVPANGE